MKVCHILTKPELGGAQLSTLQIISGLPRERYRISFISSSSGVIKDDFLKAKDTRVFLTPFLERRINPIRDILAFIHIYLLILYIHPQIVHTHSSKAGILGRWAAWLAGVPNIVHTVHGWSFNDYQNFILKRVFIFAERLTASFSTRIICVCESDVKKGLKNRIGRKEQYVIIKYGIPLEKFKKKYNNSKKRKELGIDNNDPIIAMVACLKPQKRPLDYIRVCKEVYQSYNRVNFLSVGDGVLRPLCEKELASSVMDGRFKLCGWRRDVEEILDTVDIVVLTSAWEGMPLALIEALSKGCIAIATNVDGTKELIEDGVTGYLTLPGNIEDMKEKIIFLLKNRDVMESIRNNAANSIDSSFDSMRFVKDIDSLYTGMVSGGRA